MKQSCHSATRLSKWNIPIPFHEADSSAALPDFLDKDDAEHIETTHDGWPPNEAGDENQ